MVTDIIEIDEIFSSVQGEGIQIGKPMVFIRTHGCNLKCEDCDTKYSWRDDVESMRLIPQEILSILNNMELTSAHWINFTGGEPFLQDLEAVIKKLRLNNWKVTCETNGTIIPSYLKLFDFVTISPKLPSMNPKFPFKESVVKGLLRGSKNNQLKFVVTSTADLEEIHKFACSINLTSPLVFQPNGMDDILARDGSDSASMVNGARLINYLEKVKWLWEAIQDPKWSEFDIRVIPQLHTMLYGHKKGI